MSDNSTQPAVLASAGFVGLVATYYKGIGGVVQGQTQMLRYARDPANSLWMQRLAAGGFVVNVIALTHLAVTNPIDCVTVICGIGACHMIAEQYINCYNSVATAVTGAGGAVGTANTAITSADAAVSAAPAGDVEALVNGAQQTYVLGPNDYLLIRGADTRSPRVPGANP
jgi:hypothetical protein